MNKYRIFMVGFGGTFHCPFSFGFTDSKKHCGVSEPRYFDSVDDATEFIRKHITEQGHDYVILPVVSL
jgi:hypothetical protein